jgi:hypothetical protein
MSELNVDKEDTNAVVIIKNKLKKNSDPWVITVAQQIEKDRKQLELKQQQLLKDQEQLKRDRQYFEKCRLLEKQKFEENSRLMIENKKLLALQKAFDEERQQFELMRLEEYQRIEFFRQMNDSKKFVIVNAIWGGIDYTKIFSSIFDEYNGVIIGPLNKTLGDPIPNVCKFLILKYKHENQIYTFYWNEQQSYQKAIKFSNKLVKIITVEWGSKNVTHLVKSCGVIFGPFNEKFGTSIDNETLFVQYEENNTMKTFIWKGETKYQEVLSLNL